MSKKNVNWRSLIVEFLSIFVAVTLAFALERWNENRRESRSEEKILQEIKNGLQLDLVDLKQNKKGHLYGLRACNYFDARITNSSLPSDSNHIYYGALTSDFVSIQNRSGYESLQSLGMQAVSNDSLRLKIITMYDVEYEKLEKVEEQYAQTQLFDNYHRAILQALAPRIQFSPSGQLQSIDLKKPYPQKEKQLLRGYFWHIRITRLYSIQEYERIIKEAEQLIADIERELS